MLLDEETLKKSSQIDQSIIEYFQANPSPPLDWTDADFIKAAMDGLSKQGLAMVGAPESSITEEYKQIPMRDGFQSSIKIHKPTTPPSGGSPLIVFLYGGAWISGDMDIVTPFARAWIRLFGAVVVGISYRLAPEYKFPTGQHDALDSVKWIAENAADLGADPTKGFVVGGVSAGAQLTAMVTTEEPNLKLAHPITGQWLCVPSLMNENNVPDKYKSYFHSLKHNKDAPIINTTDLEAISKHVEWDDKSPLRWPVLSDTPLSSLPPTYFQADGADPLRDDALIYEEMLKEAGAKTKIDFYPGCPHAHFAFVPGVDISVKALGDLFIGMGWLLGREVTREQGLGSMAPAS